MSEFSLIIILGHTNDLSGQLSEVACARLDKGLAVYRERPESRILLTGAFGEHFNQTSMPHAAYAKAYLLGQGLAESSIVEPFVMSGNTIEDGAKSKPM